jgi:hypothetical protein
LKGQRPDLEGQRPDLEGQRPDSKGKRSGWRREHRSDLSNSPTSCIRGGMMPLDRSCWVDLLLESICSSLGMSWDRSHPRPLGHRQRQDRWQRLANRGSGLGSGLLQPCFQPFSMAGEQDDHLLLFPEELFLGFRPYPGFGS